jgi:hypothetical protein
MPRTYSSIDKIRAELASVNETPDPIKCGCRNLRSCKSANASVAFSIITIARQGAKT